jgi:2-dehydro-3-deoxy-D-arabinonate dehydratase
MLIIRFLNDTNSPSLAAVTDENEIYTLPYPDLMQLTETAEEQGVSSVKLIQNVIKHSKALQTRLAKMKLLVPIDAPEVWAAGVTYERSREARNYETTGGRLDSVTCYDKVYDADRPELFMKSTSARTVGTGEDVYLRSDSHWQIPEPELGLVLNRNGRIIGYTIGNDMSSRDIEGENPLYLPQAKIWHRSCSIGPAIRLAETIEDPYRFEIICRIHRNGIKVFEGSANTSQLKRKLDDLVSYLARDNIIFDGTVLLTGTCIVPPNEFTLEDGDCVDIEIPGIGILSNPVKLPNKKKTDKSN